MVQSEYRASVEGNKGRGRPQRGWRDETKELVIGKGGVVC